MAKKASSRKKSRKKSSSVKRNARAKARRTKKAPEGYTKNGFPKHVLRRNARKLGTVLRENNMGTVTLK